MRMGRGADAPAHVGDMARSRAATERVLEVLSPTRCAGCERPGELICPACLDALELIDPRTCCSFCGAPFGRMLCTECSHEEGPLGSCLAMAGFAGPLPRIIRAYKDQGERRLAQPLGQILWDAVSHARDVDPARFGPAALPDAVVFVPATSQAFGRRGFDHMEAVARSFCSASGLPVLDALLKHAADDQRDLGRAGRERNAEGAYEVCASVAGARLLLIDDVITTGATMRAAAQALLDAGAKLVCAAACARVW